MALVSALALSCTPRIVKVACIGDSIGKEVTAWLEEVVVDSNSEMCYVIIHIQKFMVSGRAADECGQ